MSGTPTNFNPDVPPTPEPLYPDTPWWAVLVAVLVTAVISVVGTVVMIKGSADDVKAAAGAFSGVSILTDTVTYTPHIILLFGVLADMFTYSGVYSIPSLIGVLSIFANFVFRYFWVGLNSLLGAAKETAGPIGEELRGGKKQAGGGPARYFQDYDGCNVQGFESFGSRFAPQTLVVTATVFSYYIFDLVKNRGWLNSVAALVIGPLLFITQAMIIGNCTPDDPVEAAKTDAPTSITGKAIRALAEGLLFGGTSYAIVQTYYPNRLPSSAISPFPRRSKDDLSPGPDGKLYDKSGYPWVVMPNGQTFPDISSARARKAFAAVASVNLGTGRPASQSCSS